MINSTCLLHFDRHANIVRTSLSAVRQVGAHLWLGCDETATLERLTWRGDEASDHRHISIADFLELPGPDDEEIDVEGIAYSDHYLWFVGSHSLKRKPAKLDRTSEENVKRLRKVEREANRYTLGRIPLVDGELAAACPHPEDQDILLTAAQLKRKKKGNELTHCLADDPHLGEFLKSGLPGKDNGLDIEGLAVWEERLLLGLRGPVLRGWSVLLELQVAEEELGTLRLKKNAPDKGRYRKHFVDLGGLGIRDLCPHGDQLLILAGPTMVLDGSIRVFSLPLEALASGQSMLTPTVVLDIPHGSGCDRAEGMTLIESDQPELLVVYDAPSSERLQGDQAVFSDRILLSGREVQPQTAQPAAVTAE